MMFTSSGGQRHVYLTFHNKTGRTITKGETVRTSDPKTPGQGYDLDYIADAEGIADKDVPHDSHGLMQITVARFR